MNLNICPSKYRKYYFFFTDLARALGKDFYTELRFDSPEYNFYNCQYNIKNNSIECKYCEGFVGFYLDSSKYCTIEFLQDGSALFCEGGVTWAVYIN